MFRRDGYASTSLERIAQAAGYSKGAIYSNFDSKEAIFLAVFEAQGDTRLAELIAGIDAAQCTQDAIELLVAWANERSRSGSWSMTILEHARHAGIGSESVRKQEQIIRSHWLRLGTCVAKWLPGYQKSPETLGALMHEIAYAPAMTFVTDPTAGDLMRVTLDAIAATKA